MRKAKAVGAKSSFVLAMIIAAGTIADVARASPDEPPAGFEWKDGAEVYAKVCSYCHETQVGPPIRKRELPPAYIRAIVRNGNRAMPAFRASEIDDESLSKLAEYISKN
jgi:mono/diheme cytochrome c family protein